MFIQPRHLRPAFLLALAVFFSGVFLQSAPATPSNQIIKIDWKEQGKAVNGSWEAHYKNTFRLSSMWTGTIGGGASIGGKMVLVGAGMSSPVGLYKVRGSLLGLNPGDMLQYYLSESDGSGTETVGASPPTRVPMKESLSREGMFFLSIGEKTFMEGDLKFRKDQGIPLNENFPEIGRAYSRAIDVKRTKDGIEVILGTSNFTLPYSPRGPNFPEDDCSQAEGTQEKVFQDLKSFKFTNAELQNPGQLTKSRMSSNSVEGDTYTASVTIAITEEEDNTEVSVDPEASYESWLPEGNLVQPDKPGNDLIVRIKIHKKGDPSSPRKANLSISMSDVSRNEGVCMNWPAESRPGEEGLRFRQEDFSGDGPLAFISSSRLETNQPVEQAEIHVHAYDFGAFGTLRVTAKDQRGKEATVKTLSKERPDLGIPLDENHNRIADHWEVKNGVVGENGNSDLEASEGNSNLGDGFTLFEEYRGLVAKGEHQRLDPKKKELFIVNKCGAAVDAGIALFEQAADLKIIQGIETEIDPNRVVNFHGNSVARGGSQHGLVLDFGETDGGAAQAQPVKSGATFTPSPGAVQRINFAQGFNSFGPAAAAKDVAHELGHACGLRHHGDAGTVQLDSYLFDRNGNLVFPAGDTNWDLYDAQGRLITQRPFTIPAGGKVAWSKGTPAGGDVGCVMCYESVFSFAYQAGAGRKQLMNKPEAAPGTGLCTGTTGTQYNAPGHLPWPLFGDADAGRGNCKSKVKVKD